MRTIFNALAATLVAIGTPVIGLGAIMAVYGYFVVQRATPGPEGPGMALVLGGLVAFVGFVVLQIGQGLLEELKGRDRSAAQPAVAADGACAPPLYA